MARGWLAGMGYGWGMAAAGEMVVGRYRVEDVVGRGGRGVVWRAVDILVDLHGPLPLGRAAAVGLGILDALTASHDMGIVHRDIKPGNVLVLDGDRVKLTGFGIALAAEVSRLTHGYLAPECFGDGQVGPAPDLWALGATLFHAVAGHAPYERPTTTLRAILFEPAPPPPCPSPLAEVITGLLTRAVDERLTGDTARRRLEQAATLPDPAPPVVGYVADEILGAMGTAGASSASASRERQRHPPPAEEHGHRVGDVLLEPTPIRPERGPARDPARLRRAHPDHGLTRRRRRTGRRRPAARGPG